MGSTAGDFQSYLFHFFICFVSAVLLWFLTKKTSKTTTVPPGPPALPIIGHLHLLSSNLPISLQNLASRYGAPLMRIRIGASSMFVVSNATTARQVLKTHDQIFSSRAGFGGSSSSSDLHINKGRSFFAAAYGPYWRFLKKICMTELLSAPQLNRFTDIRREEMMNLLKVLAKCSEEGKACDVGLELMTMTNNIICRMAMSTRCSGDAEGSSQIRELTKGIGQLAAKLGRGDVLGPLLKNLDLFGDRRKIMDTIGRFYVLLEGIMVEHEKKERNSSPKKDMMDILLEIYKDETAAVRITRSDIKAFLLDIFLGGTDTSSLAVQWTLAELINHPDVFKKLREEINRVVGASRIVEESDVPNLPYLQAVIKESLRLHPPIPLIPRTCKEACKIKGYDVLANERMLINVYAIMRDPDLWNDPTEFAPERFLVSSSSVDDDQVLDMKGQTFHFLPFGSGRRACPGAGLASAVMQVTTAALVQCFDFKIKGGEKVNMAEESGFSQGMAHPLVCYPITHISPLLLSDL